MHRILLNGTVDYRVNNPRSSCKSLLRALGSKRSSSSSSHSRSTSTTSSDVYGVVDLESLATSSEYEHPREKCLATLHGLGDAVVGRLHRLALEATNGAARSAHVMLRAGTANISRYPLHFDRGVENYIVQISGRKRLTLLPPSQAPHAALGGGARRGNMRTRHDGDAILMGGGELVGSGEEMITNERRSQIDFSLPPAVVLNRWPSVSRLRGLRVRVASGDILFIPSGWLHMVDSNESPRGACIREGKAQRRRTRRAHAREESESTHGSCSVSTARGSNPWLSANLFFTHPMQPTFKLFDSCDSGHVETERAKLPAPHAAAFERLGVERARAAYC